VEARAAAGKIAAVAALAGPGQSSGSEDFVDLEIGSALRLGSGGASRLVAVARQLAGKLPKTMVALADGRIDYLRALRIAEATFGLDAAACAAVEARVLGRAAHQSAGQVGAAARRAVAAVDPDALTRRHRQARADADVRLAHDEDGMGWITANLPSLDAQLVYVAVDAWARATKAAGDTRTLGQLRGVALLEWSEAYLSGRPVAPDGEPWPDADAEPGDIAPDAGRAGDAASAAYADAGRAGDAASATDAESDADAGWTGDATSAAYADAGRAGDAAGAPVGGTATEPDDDMNAEAPCDFGSQRAVGARPGSGFGPRADAVRGGDGEPEGNPGAGRARNAHVRGGRPTWHGRPVTVNVTVDLPTFLGLTDHPGEVQPGGLMPADAIRDLIPDARLRRLIVDPMTGALLDYGRRTYRVPADLAAFVTARDATAATPGATGPSTSGDLDHLVPYEDGGATNRANLQAISRRWHRAKTIGGWQVARHDDGSVTWTSPLGRTYRCHPHDYRLGP
jgi:hypothetical protein